MYKEIFFKLVYYTGIFFFNIHLVLGRSVNTVDSLMHHSENIQMRSSFVIR